MPITNDFQTCDPENFFPRVKRYEHITIPHEKDLGTLIDDCDRFITWVYKAEKKDHDLRGIPRITRGNIDAGTINGILFRIGNKRRPKKQPEPFALWFGKRIMRSGNMCVYDPLGIMIPMPDLDSIKGFESIRWVTVYRDRLVYTIRIYEEVTAGSVSDLPNVEFIEE